MKLLAKAPDQRHANARELRRELDAIERAGGAERTMALEPDRRRRTRVASRIAVAVLSDNYISPSTTATSPHRGRRRNSRSDA